MVGVSTVNSNQYDLHFIAFKRLVKYKITINSRCVCTKFPIEDGLNAIWACNIEYIV